MFPEIPIYSINAYLYCEYRYFLEEVVGIFKENAHISEGKYINEKESKNISTKNWKKTSKIFVSSEEYGIYGYIDNVIKTPDKIKIVEIKKGSAKKPYENDIMQIIAYMIAYSETFEIKKESIIGELNYKGSNTKFRVKLTDNRLNKLKNIIDNIYAIKSDKIRPIPKYRKKCKDCSLFEICQPINNEKVKIMPRIVEKQPIFLFSHGIFIGKKGESFLFTLNNEKNVIPAYKISSINIFGIFTISRQAVELAAKYSIPIIINNSICKNITTINIPFSKNNFLRKKQVELSSDEKLKLELSKKMIIGKIRNMEITLKKKNIKINYTPYIYKINKASTSDEIIGIEGIVSRNYFENFGNILNNFTFNTRTRRPPKDPINSLLSFGYTILYNLVHSILLSIGLDPYFGFLHTTQYGRGSLALDLMEEFRPLIIDTSVIKVINKSMIKEKDFIKENNGIYLKQKARKKFVNVILKRLLDKHYYDKMGGSIEYIRIIESQARLLQKHILGELEYTPFIVKK
ncbi:hypothetical protein XJ44_01485 [Thermosipho affectus]|uniref:CRISPR-associated endonuclease Cas1 n=1 Tax=Thermosipho affectus TaxID=660294 RepID=A0ABX3IL35_9BACT|nr:CRISPR-associated endonuclease Cas4/Cas1 [Thermosipho affectus]ONN27907.1 hypothetical protein XJ44_01485 [Thermosipho affectus]